MTSKLTESQKKDLHSLFHTLDKDNDGLIEIKEIATLLRALGQNPTSTELKDIENNNEAVLDCQAAIALIDEIGLKTLEEEEEELRIAFRAIDRDNNGSISKDELKFYLRAVQDPMSDEEIDEIMEMSDANKDGVIDYAEFITVMAAHIM